MKGRPQVASLAHRVTRRLLTECAYAKDLLAARVRGGAVRAYWYKEVSNFGDGITPLLLRNSGRNPVYSPPTRASVVSTGSLLEHISESYSGCILGTGFISAASSCRFPNARVISVRGLLTLERTERTLKTVSVGDPGLLACDTLKTRAEKRYTIGLIPHVSDKDSPIVAEIARRHGTALTTIDVQDGPLSVFQLIDQCEYVLSSSLHGLIVADSLGVPCRWIESSAPLLGGRFKFDDYHSSIGFDNDPAVLGGSETIAELTRLVEHKSQDAISDTKAATRAAWSTFLESN